MEGYMVDSCPLRSGADGFILKGTNNGEEYAIKLFELSTKEKIHRFNNEVAIGELLSPLPGTVSIKESFSYHGYGYVVMNLAEQDLLDFIETEGQLSENNTILVLEELCGTLESLHDLGIAHLDIKPENILLSKEGTQLCDFANSITCTKQVSNQKTFISTPAYTAPERFSSSTFDPKAADIWSLGVLLHVLITGCYPFAQSSQPQQYPRTLEFSFISSMVSPLCFDLLKSMLNPEPSKRPQISEILLHPVFDQKNTSEMQTPAQF